MWELVLTMDVDSTPLLPNSNLGKYFFNDMVKNILISPRLLVEEDAV
jgi:hypothetical protein